MTGYYRVQTIDPVSDDSDDHGFYTRVARCKKWTLRTVLRRLYSMGYSDVSVLVEKIDDQAPAN